MRSKTFKLNETQVCKNANLVRAKYKPAQGLG